MSSDNWCTPGNPGQSIDPERQTPKPGIDDTNLVDGLVSSMTCSMPLEWDELTGFYRQLLVQHFCEADNIRDHSLKSFIWSDDDKETKIGIESHNKRTDWLVGMRPFVIIKRNSIQNYKFGVANISGKDERGFETFSVGWVGSHTFFCKHGNGSGAEKLGKEVQKFMTEWGPELVRRFGFIRSEVVSVDAVQEIEEDKEVGVVPVTVGWALQQNWKIEQESPKIFRIYLSALLCK